MPWFKVDDTLHSHPKARRTSLAAMGMWVLAGSFSAAYPSDGFISETWVATFPVGRRRAAELVAAGLWVAGTYEEQHGWFFHDWNDFQPSKAEVKADKAAAAERQRRHREKVRNKETGRFENDLSRRDKRVSHAVSHTAPSRPDPTRPVKASTRVETKHHPLRSVPREAGNG